MVTFFMIKSVITIITLFHLKIELVQRTACLALTGAISGTSKRKLYEELALESLRQQQ